MQDIKARQRQDMMFLGAVVLLLLCLIGVVYLIMTVPGKASACLSDPEAYTEIIRDTSCYCQDELQFNLNPNP